MESLLSFWLLIAFNNNPLHVHFYSLQRTFLDIISFDIPHNVTVGVKDVVLRLSIIFLIVYIDEERKGHWLHIANARVRSNSKNSSILLKVYVFMKLAVQVHKSQLDKGHLFSILHSHTYSTTLP